MHSGGIGEVEGLRRTSAGHLPFRMARSVLTIGNFDGVHAGHGAIVERARELGDRLHAKVVTLCFDPHPATRLRPESAPARLTSFERRAELLARCGAHAVERLEPTAELLAMSPEAFVSWAVERFAPAAWVEGPDFRFGRARAGDLGMLANLGATMGFGVEVAPLVSVSLSDGTMARASSTLARWLIERGRVRDAWSILTRPYELEGVVVRGDRRGRELGFPTANLDTACMLPGDGVYAGLALLPGGGAFPAAVSVGDKPMFGGRARVAEIHVLDAARDGDALAGLPEYGWRVRVMLVGWLREQVRFGSIDELLAQMTRDCARVREVVRERLVPGGSGG